MKAHGLEFRVVETQDNHERNMINLNHLKYYRERKPNLAALKDMITKAGMGGMGNDLGISV